MERLPTAGDDDDALQDATEEQQRLQECYHAFLARRVARGGRSIRTRRGFEQLRANYQSRVRFLLDQSSTGTATSDNSDGSLRELVGPYVDQRVLQLVAEVCWPLVHFGPRDEGRSRLIPDWQELGATRYFAVMVNILLWMFPGLPSFEVQELMERDWQSDRDFDPYGNEGLSLEGFTVSMIDLAVACTNGNVDRCLEFIQHLADRLQASLAPVHDIEHYETPNDMTRDQSPSSVITAKQLRWRTIPMGQLVPCKPRQKPQYYELKAKASSSPMVLMVLTGNEKPFEFQLSSSAKLLVRERDSRTSIRRKTIALKTHLVEMEKQILWTLRDWGGVQPSVFLIPSTSISQRALKLYGCLRLLDSNEQQLHLGATNELVDSKQASTPIFTVYTSIQDPTTMPYGDDESTCGRIERQGSQLFVLDHRQRCEPFVVTLKTSLLQSTNAGGGAGAVAVVSHSSTATTKMVIDDTIDDVPTASNCAGELPPHTFVFVVKDQNEFAAPSGSGVHRQTGALPQQWCCAMSAADESKQIVVQPQGSSGHKASGLYYMYIFSLHGVYYEAIYDKTSDRDQEAVEGDATPMDYTPPRSLDAPSNDIQVEDDEENEELSAVIEAGLSGGATLLRCLLKMRQKRKKHVQAKPLPEFIEGTKVDTMKALTAAVTLRGKFLKAREMARHARVMEREKTFANGLVELVTKHNTSFKRSRQSPKESTSLSNQLANSNTSTNVGNPDDALEAQVQLLASFFREMAIHVPPEADAEEDNGVDCTLIDQFGELFERDTKLLNILDEEKWMPNKERLNRAHHRGDTKMNSVFGEGEPVHDDYINTAEYIEDLMRAAAEQERDIDGGCDSVKQQPIATSPLQQLQTSWVHAQLRSKSNTQSQRQLEAQAVQLESIRRQEWMKSHHVTDVATQARFAAILSPNRTPMSLSKTAFDNERHQLPWNPVWEVVDTSENVDACALSDQHEAAAHDPPFAPKRPRERPKTTSSTVRTACSTGKSCEGEGKQIGRDAETAATSASFAYANRMRLERVRTADSCRTERRMSSHSAPFSRSSPKSPSRMVPASLPTPRQPGRDGASSSHSCRMVAGMTDHLASAFDLLAEKKPKCDSVNSFAEPTATNDCLPESTVAKAEGECSPSEATAMMMKEPSDKKRRRRKPLSKSASSMHRRVKELLEVSKAVKEQRCIDESVAPEGILPATSDFQLPARSKVQFKNRK